MGDRGRRSGRARLGLAAALAAVLLGSMVLWAWARGIGTIGYYGLVLYPEQYEGRHVVLSLVRIRAVDGPDRYRVVKGPTAIAVNGPTRGLRPGDEVSIGGRWRAREGALEQEWIEQHTGARRVKRRLGVVGLLVATALTLGAVRREEGGLALRG